MLSLMDGSQSRSTRILRPVCNTRTHRWEEPSGSCGEVVAICDQTALVNSHIQTYRHLEAENDGQDHGDAAEQHQTTSRRRPEAFVHIVSRQSREDRSHEILSIGQSP